MRTAIEFLGGFLLGFVVMGILVVLAITAFAFTK